ncbi:N-acetylmuramoyl-L-alanine amidase [Paenibacillus sp. GCM10027626]|uniref:N-acetylmuramoyl-L-alanine amidase n=1 Tax=Paenibacillus sp. GCM10027626 TaxID=3273411 RepID=UPI00362D2D5E
MNYIKDHIPLSTPHRRRQGTKIIPTTITIHNTGNPSSTARNERGWLTNPSNEREASFHIVIDQLEAIECIPTNEKALHAGSANGNMTSIGIEICESGDYAKTLDNAAQLVADMLRERGWGTERLRRHYDWSGKICPHLMYDGGRWTGWQSFIDLVQVKLKPAAPATQPTEKIVLAPDKISVEVNGVLIRDSWLDSKNGITYVPLRAVAEALGAQVKYDSSTKTAKVTK